MSSEEYKKAISNTIRETKAEIQFDFIDTTAKTDCTPIIPSQAIYSKADQILNDNTSKSIKITTLEKNFWKLDSSYINLGYKDISNEEIGFVSEVISDGNGIFATPPVFEFTFTTTHSSIGLTLFFDDSTNNYIKKMRIKFYNGETLLSDETVENSNTTYIYSNRVENYNKVEIEFLETSLPYRRARFLDIIFGIIQLYKDKQIINCNLTREISVFNENIPSHELDFEIDNLSKEFNLINPTGVYAYLQKRQLVSLRMGVVLENGKNEFLNMGKYYLSEWETKNLTATLKAKDSISFLEEIKYSNSTMQTKSLKEFVIEILNYAGISEYVIDESLSNISSTTAIEETSIKELLKQIAIASNCVLFVDKEDKVNIVKLAENISNNITLANMYDVPNILLDEIVNRIKVSYFIAGNSNELIISSDEINGKEKTLSSIFINTLEHAQTVGEYMLSLYQNRLKYKMDWRQDLDIDVNQKVNIEDDFEENKDIVITKQEFKYSGYLSGNSEGRAI